MNKKIINLLMKGRLDEVRILLVNENVFSEEIEDWVYDTNNIVLYSLVVNMLIKKETVRGHERAAYLLSMPLCVYKDSYSLGLFHARRALALDPNSLRNKRFLLFFHDIPEQLIKKDEAIKIAREVLKEDPDCTVSKRILKSYGFDQEREICNK